MTLAIRTDKPEAELYLYNGTELIGSDVWVAHRELSTTLLSRIEMLLQSCHTDLNALKAIRVFTGPGSFTGLRIGVTVANTLAYALSIPVIGARGGHWREKNSQDESKSNGVVPHYGSVAHITKPRK